MLVPPFVAEKVKRKVLVLEPRRMAAKLAAAGASKLAGSTLGGRFGYRVRGETNVSEKTEIEFLTCGVFLRILQGDPALSGVGAVIFDEFHERSMESDLALALVRESRGALRSDLVLVLMSATLDCTALSESMQTPVITAEGRLFPLETRFASGGVSGPELALETAKKVLQACREEQGNLLVFLPGEREIRQCCEILKPALPDTEIAMLFGALPLKEQENALHPPETGHRKIVLATNVAESSITVDGIRIVVDSGFERVLRHDRASGLDFLELRRISRASAIQRAGRAGRLEMGVVYPLFSRNEFQHMAAFSPPEIFTADLSFLVLEALLWGSAPEKLLLPDAPERSALAKARENLTLLGALSAGGALTKKGRAMEKLHSSVRLASLLYESVQRKIPALGAETAALLSLRRRRSDDLRESLCQERKHPSGEFIREFQLNCRLLHCAEKRENPEHLGLLCAAAFPEFVASQRERHGREYVMRCGRCATLAQDSTLNGAPFLAVTELAGSSGIIRSAVALEEEEIEELFADAITEKEVLEQSEKTLRSSAWRIRALGGAVLSKKRAALREETVQSSLFASLREKGLTLLEFSPAVFSLLNRVRYARAIDGEDYPDWSEEKLLSDLELWLEPYCAGIRDLAGLKKLDILTILHNTLGYDVLRRLEADFPEFVTTPAGARHRIDYTGNPPKLSVRVGELYGMTVHPVLGRKKIPLKLELLNPAQRPVQITSDLPGFWKGSWALARKELKSRYPKHVWPEDPAAALPTLQAKNRPR